MSDYTPIDCELYSRYELAIMHRQKLRLAWRDPEGTYHLETLLPVDLRTRDHAEYLLSRTKTGRVIEMRLDRIIRMVPLQESGK
jgi:Rho-binding antiterminator